MTPQHADDSFAGIDRCLFDLDRCSIPLHGNRGEDLRHGAAIFPAQFDGFLPIQFAGGDLFQKAPHERSRDDAAPPQGDRSFKDEQEDQETADGQGDHRYATLDKGTERHSRAGNRAGKLKWRLRRAFSGSSASPTAAAKVTTNQGEQELTELALGGVFGGFW